MTTNIPSFILALLFSPEPGEVQTSIEPVHNIICWSTPARSVCFKYIDEGTHLAIQLGEEE